MRVTNRHYLGLFFNSCANGIYDINIHKNDPKSSNPCSRFRNKIPTHYKSTIKEMLSFYDKPAIQYVWRK